MRLLFFFLDGVGLGPDEPGSNPFAQARMPNLQRLLGGRKLVCGAAPVLADRASLVAIDACLGVKGNPQSATGQAALLTGRNVPAQLGKHFGPWPSGPIVEMLKAGNLFAMTRSAGRQASLLNAYPARYFAAIDSGRRSYSAIPRAATSAGLALKTTADLLAGRAISVDFTGGVWRDRLDIPETPALTLDEAGRRIAELAMSVDFSFFEYWPTDHAGHRQDMAAAVTRLENLDEVWGGLLASWRDDEGLILLTSDHGNLEDLSTRGHTRNPVPALVIGAPHLRAAFTAELSDLTDVAPAILGLLNV